MSNNELVVYLPLLTAVITALLTFLLTSLKENRSSRILNRLFLEYGEYDLMVPFDKSVPEKLGKGLVYWGDDSNNIRIEAEKKGRIPCTFLVLKNSTSNDAVNIIINKECTDNTRVVREDFAIPYWSHQSLLYLPITFFGAKGVSIRLKKMRIEYSTKSLERFRFEIMQNIDGSYKKTLSKKYLNLIWLKKVDYSYVGQLHFQKVE